MKNQSHRFNAGFSLIGICVLLGQGCASHSNRNWGQNATLLPGWNRVTDAAKEAALDPHVWVPLAGAAVLQIDDFDQRLSDWARDRTPLFGSQSNAAQWSNNLRSTAVVAEFATLLATPSGDEPEEWMLNKVKGGLVQVAAIGATSLSTLGLKKAAGRERPNREDEESFPSGHASSAAVHARMAEFNLKEMGLDPRVERVADYGLEAVTYGTAWARVESGYHYPSDTLAGIALGNFFASFFNRTFLNEPNGSGLTISAQEGGAVLNWRSRF